MFSNVQGASQKRNWRKRSEQHTSGRSTVNSFLDMTQICNHELKATVISCTGSAEKLTCPCVIVNEEGAHEDTLLSH